jgi:hypothetical protein
MYLAIDDQHLAYPFSGRDNGMAQIPTRRIA